MNNNVKGQGVTVSMDDRVKDNRVNELQSQWIIKSMDYRVKGVIESMDYRVNGL